MQSLWHDLRYGWRILQRNPGFAAVAALTLAIGIGANGAIFSAVDAFLLRPLPYPHANRIVIVWHTSPSQNISRGTASAAEFLDWRGMTDVFDGLAAWRYGDATVTGRGEPEQVVTTHVSANFFQLLGVKPIFGRDFLPDEEHLGHEKVALLGYRFWRRKFDADRSVLGKPIILDYEPYQIIGVLPPNFSLFGTHAESDVWVPLAFTRAQLDRSQYELVVFGRLKPGVPIARAQAEMDTINAALKKRYPQMDQRAGMFVETFQDSLTHGLRPAMLIFLWAVAFVLLIACANVANLMLARAVSREREMALRTALGAERRRIFRQLLTESVLLAAMGGLLGLLVAWGGIRFIRAEMPQGLHEIPFASSIRLNGEVLAFMMGLSLVTGILFGLAPALQISRSELSESLKEGGRGSTGGRRSHLLRSSLVVSEVALCLLLLAGAGLLIRGFVRLMSQNLGFDPANVLTMQIWLPRDHYSGTQAVNFYQQALDQVRALPGVTAASAVDYLMFTGWSSNFDFDIGGRTPPRPGEPFTSDYRVIDSRFLRTMGIPIIAGRNIRDADGPDSAGVVLIDQALAHRYWPNENPVGQQIRIHVSQENAPWQAQEQDSWLTIVGVTGDTHEWDWGVKPIPMIYLPLQQEPSWLMSLVIRQDGESKQILPAVRHIVSSLDANQPVTNVRTMEDLLNDVLAQRRLNMVLLAIFAAIAVLLAAVGIYGVMAYAVSQRTHEIGVRMALGAEPSDVLRMIVGEAMRLAAIGIAIGWVSSIAVARYFQGELYGIELHGLRSVDPLTFLGVPVLIAVVAVLAAYFPARRATTVDPLVALRYE